MYRHNENLTELQKQMLSERRAKRISLLLKISIALILLIIGAYVVYSDLANRGYIDFVSALALVLLHIIAVSLFIILCIKIFLQKKIAFKTEFEIRGILTEDEVFIYENLPSFPIPYKINTIEQYDRLINKYEKSLAVIDKLKSNGIDLSKIVHCNNDSAFVWFMDYNDILNFYNKLSCVNSNTVSFPIITEKLNAFPESRC